MKLTFARSPSAEWNAEMFGDRGGVRQKCKGFSFGSRRRMLDKLNSVSVAAELPQFVTATLPDDVFDDDAGRFARSAKVWMDNFTKRLKRVCPKAAGFWRIEWQSRKSGLHEGKLFPHFHLLVWGLPVRKVDEFYRWDVDGRPQDLVEVFEAFVEVRDSQLQWELIRTHGTRAERVDYQMRCQTDHKGQPLVFSGSAKFVNRCRDMLADLTLAEYSEKNSAPDQGRKMRFQDWASLAWYHVVDSHNVDHLAAGLRVERVKTWGGVMSYCAKYMAKTDSGFLSDVQFGRSWGIFNREFIPWARIVELDLEPAVGNRLRRVMRHYMERRRGRRVRSPYGITLYGDVERFRKLWTPALDPDPF
jgi:hypothetical protein